MLRSRATRPLAVAAGLLAAACGSGASGSSGGPTPTQAAVPPALVQVENNSAARPQWGLKDAAAVYEYVTEGGITRFSALYTSSPPGRVGPVRSARLVTIRLARIYGAVIVYSGASTAVQQALDASNLPHVDEKSSGGDLFRIGDRQAPHNLVSDGQHLSDLLGRFRGHALASTLWSRTATTAASQGRAVTSFTVPFSDAEQPVFSYDAAAAGWKRSEPDTGPFVDAGTRQAVVPATVIVQQVAINQTDDVEDVNGQHGVDIVVSGGGAAQVFTAGREYDATWSQGGTGAPSFKLSDGSSAPIAPGLVWICLVPSGTTATAS